MKATISRLSLSAVLVLAAAAASAGVLDPDCTAEKAARSAAAKATVGVGGRCSPKEAVADSAKKATGVDDKGLKDRSDDKDKKDKDKDEKKVSDKKDEGNGGWSLSK